MTRVRYACEWTSVGIGVAAQRALGAIVGAERSFDVAWEPLHADPHGRTRTAQSAAAASWLRALRRPRADGEILVQHSVPGAWKQVAAELAPSSQVGHAVWELDEVPAAWRSLMADVDAFWVPTEWNQRAFAAAFDRPVHVVPHVTTDVTPTAPPMHLPDGVAVVAAIAAWDWRKRPDRTIEAFCRAFQGRDDVVLAVKTTPWDVGWPGGMWNVPQLIQRIVERVPDAPPVRVSVDVWSPEQVAGLLERSVCTFSMTSSEGWGLGAFDGAVLGRPAIITGFGGQVEYLGENYPGLIPFRRVPTTHTDRGLFAPGTEWAHADADAAIDLLRAAVDRRAFDEHAVELSAELRERYAPRRVGARMVGLLDEMGASSPAGAVIPLAPSARGGPSDSAAEVVILTPVKNAADHAEAYVDRVLALSYPNLRVAVLVSDSTDGTAESFRRAFGRLTAAGIASGIYERDFGYTVPDGTPRWDPAIQLERRTVLAKSRNHLLARGLGDAAWALWIDVDVVDYPNDVTEQLLSVGGDIVHPHCVGSDGTTFDLNAWTDHGQHHLDNYRGAGVVELHAVGGTMLLVRADVHRDGLIWPAYRHGVANERVRTDPAMVGRPQLGEVETEGLAIMANDMGVACWGLPDLVITHE